MIINKQYTLDGKETNNNLLVSTSLFRIFRKGDSLWRTLKFFYNAEMIGVMGLLKSQVRKAHNKHYPVTHGTLDNNIMRLQDEQLIKIIATGLGKTHRAILYKITDKGIVWFQEALNSDVNWARELE